MVDNLEEEDIGLGDVLKHKASGNLSIVIGHPDDGYMTDMAEILGKKDDDIGISIDGEHKSLGNEYVLPEFELHKKSEKVDHLSKGEIEEGEKLRHRITEKDVVITSLKEKEKDAVMCKTEDHEEEMYSIYELKERGNDKKEAGTIF